MNRTELVDAVASKAGSTKAEAAKAVDAVTSVIAAALHDGADVKIQGFGNFDVKLKPERMARNPRTGESVRVAASKTVKFKPTRALVEKL